MKPTALDVSSARPAKAALDLQRPREAGRGNSEGRLTCGDCERRYPIRGGVPRFVPDGAYAKSFGYQWNWFRTVQLDSMNRRQPVRARRCAATTGWRDDEYRGRRLLDAGVGAGRFAERAAAKGAEVFGIDLTTAVDAAYRNIGEREERSSGLRPTSSRCRFARRRSISRIRSASCTTRRIRGRRSRVWRDGVKPGGRFAVYLYAATARRIGCPTRSRRDDAAAAAVMWALSAAAVPLYYLYRLPVVGKMRRAWRCRFPWNPTGDGVGSTRSTGTRRSIS